MVNLKIIERVAKPTIVMLCVQTEWEHPNLH